MVTKSSEATKSGSIVIETASVKTMTSETICAFTAASMEYIFKHISENIICISCKMILLISSRTTFESLETISKSTALIAASCRLVKCSVSELIVHLLLFRITQYRISFCYFFEFLFCIRISGIGIRMILLRQLTICSLYFFILCAL